jgi:hypothetical protein
MVGERIGKLELRVSARAWGLEPDRCTPKAQSLFRKLLSRTLSLVGEF